MLVDIVGLKGQLCSNYQHDGCGRGLLRVMGRLYSAKLETMPECARAQKHRDEADNRGNEMSKADTSEGPTCKPNEKRKRKVLFAINQK